MAASVAAPRPVLNRRAGRQEVINSAQKLVAPNSTIQARVPDSITCPRSGRPARHVTASPPGAWNDRKTQRQIQLGAPNAGNKALPKLSEKQSQSLLIETLSGVPPTHGHEQYRAPPIHHLLFCHRGLVSGKEVSRSQSDLTLRVQLRLSQPRCWEAWRTSRRQLGAPPDFKSTNKSPTRAGPPWLGAPNCVPIVRPQLCHDHRPQ